MGKMKIFDWVHRKFHTNVDYCMVSRKKDQYAWVDEELGVKKTEGAEKDTDALLRDHVALIKAFNGWPEGIFAIGTFGIDQPDIYRDEYSDDGEEDHFPVENDGAAAADEAVIRKDDDDALINAKDDKASGEDTTGAGDEEKASGGETTIVETGSPEYYYMTLTDEKKKKKGERTTLADLFSAEAAHLPPAPPAADPLKPPPVLPDGERHPACRKKHVGSFAKKLIMPWKGEDSRPTTKIHRLLTKMMKRKIHPEIYNTINGAQASSEENAGAELPNLGSSSSLSYNSTAHVAQNESASLLQAVVDL